MKLHKLNMCREQIAATAVHQHLSNLDVNMQFSVCHALSYR